MYCTIKSIFKNPLNLSNGHPHHISSSTSMHNNFFHSHHTTPNTFFTLPSTFIPSTLNTFFCPYRTTSNVRHSTIPSLIPKNVLLTNRTIVPPIPSFMLKNTLILMPRNNIGVGITIDMTDIIKSNDLHESVSEKLKIKYLSDSPNLKLDKVMGRVIGLNQRLLTTMNLKIRENVKNVHFLVDTGSPVTLICEEVLDAFNISDDIPVVQINGRRIGVGKSPPLCNDINILGADYLRIWNSRLLIDYEGGYFSILFSDGISDAKTSYYSNQSEKDFSDWLTRRNNKEQLEIASSL